MNRIKIKRSAKIVELNEYTIKIMCAVMHVWKFYSFPTPTITSGSESVETRIDDSLHYEHLALDFRIRDIPAPKDRSVNKAIQALCIMLDKDYQVIKYDTLIHIEYDPKLEVTES